MFYWDILCKYFPSDYFFKRATSQKSVKSYDISLFKKSCIVSCISRYLGCAMLCCVVLYCIVVEHVCAVPSWEAIHFINKLLKLYLM